jgi:hypothetical protein
MSGVRKERWSSAFGLNVTSATQRAASASRFWVVVRPMYGALPWPGGVKSCGTSIASSFPNSPTIYSIISSGYPIQ